MKKILLIMLLLVGIVNAAEGDLEVYSYKVYQEGKMIQSDFTDDDMSVNAGKNIEIQFRFENPYNESIEVDLTGVLYDIGNDIKRDKTFDIDAEDRSSSVVFEYFIPNDQSQGLYDFEVSYEYRAKGTDYDFEKHFDMFVIEEEVNLADVMFNITKNLVYEKEKNNILLTSIINMSDALLALGDCASELGTCEGNLTITSDYRKRYYDNVNESKTYSTQFTTCDTQKKSMYSQAQLEEKINAAERDAKRQQKKEDDNFLFMVAGGAVIYIWWQKKKKTIGGAGEGKPLKGKWG